MSELFSTEIGDTGPLVVFLPGLFGQGKNWTTVAKALQPGIRAMLVDLPDHGRSDWSDHFSYAEMADRVAALLRATDEPSAVVGHSMGGKVAMVLALRHPELVSRLCVVDVAPVPTSEISSFGAYVTGMRSIDLATLAGRAEADAALQPYVAKDSVRSFLLQNLRRDPAGVGWRWQMNLDLLGDHLAEVGGWPDLEAPPYPGPVLWLAGSESRYVQPAYAPAMRALFPRVRLVTVKGAGHWLHTDNPAVFLAALRQFLHL